MSKQDYTKIARVINDLAGALANGNASDAEFAVLEQTATDLGNMMREDNPRFNVATFLTACGMAWDNSAGRWTFGND